MSGSPVNPGDVLAHKYRVERLLGVGNMGVVVAAINLGLNQRVALKFMLPTRADARPQHERFLREARAVSRLRTQHVAKVLDVGTLESGAPYIVMEFLEGRDLAAVLKAQGPLPFADAVEHILQACEAVAEAHAAGIVHRDIKPANLFLASGAGSAYVKVLDFGVAKVLEDPGLAATQEGHALGSPLYMAPEQMKSSKDVDARADVWALGVTLFELVAGETPFHANTVAQLCARVFFGAPTSLSDLRPDAPTGFEAVLSLCLERERDRRYRSVADLAAALAPFGPPRAAVYAERVAAVLGVHVEPARLTDVLPVEPANVGAASGSHGSLGGYAPALQQVAAGAPAATDAAVIVPATTAPRRSQAGIFVAVGVAVLAVAVAIVAVVWGPTKEGKPSVASSAAVTAPTAATSAPVSSSPTAAGGVVPAVSASASAPATLPAASRSPERPVAPARELGPSAPPKHKKPIYDDPE